MFIKFELADWKKEPGAPNTICIRASEIVAFRRWPDYTAIYLTADLDSPAVFVIATEVDINSALQAIKDQEG